MCVSTVLMRAVLTLPRDASTITSFVVVSSDFSVDIEGKLKTGGRGTSLVTLSSVCSMEGLGFGGAVSDQLEVSNWTPIRSTECTYSVP